MASSSRQGGGGGGNAGMERELVQALNACAQVVEEGRRAAAETLLRRIRVLAASHQQSASMHKVATHFADALAMRIYSQQQQLDDDVDEDDDNANSFYEQCPYLKIAHIGANKVIADAFSESRLVHVIEFGEGLKDGKQQWISLMLALCIRPVGPPDQFRLTVVGPPNSEAALARLGESLSREAVNMKISFRFRGIAADSLADVDHAGLGICPSEYESLAVNWAFRLHRLLSRPGAVENDLALVHAMSPRVVTLVEQEADHNREAFADRFASALSYYSALFDSLEGSSPSWAADINSEVEEDVLRRRSEAYLGSQIRNLVVCEGVERVERHERLGRWRARMASAGFAPVHIGPNTARHALRMVRLYSTTDDKYDVWEDEGCMMIGWDSRPFFATSAWKLA